MMDKCSKCKEGISPHWSGLCFDCFFKTKDIIEPAFDASTIEFYQRCMIEALLSVKEIPTEHKADVDVEFTRLIREHKLFK